MQKMASNAILISIRPKYAEKIFNGSKTVELRKIKPKHLSSGDLVLVYVSSPIKSLVGAFKVEKVQEYAISEMWDNVKKNAGVSKKEFDDYYKNSNMGVAIFIESVWQFTKPIGLSDLRKAEKGFHPPQSFRYTSLQYTGQKIF